MRQEESKEISNKIVKYLGVEDISKKLVAELLRATAMVENPNPWEPGSLALAKMDRVDEKAEQIREMFRKNAKRKACENRESGSAFHPRFSSVEEIDGMLFYASQTAKRMVLSDGCFGCTPAFAKV